MKRFAKASLLLLSFSLAGAAPASQEVLFRLQAPGEAVAPGSRFQAVLEARIQEGWHLYSTTQPKGGPVPTTIEVVEEKGAFRAAGQVEQPRPQVSFDPNFGINTEYFEGTVDFRIPVEASRQLTAGRHPLSVRVRFMVCNDRLCLPPRRFTFTTPVEISAPAAGSGGAPTAEAAPPGPAKAVRDSSKLAGGAAAPLAGLPAGLWAYISFAMSMGALALLTPCVFPMIPITVSYFTKRGISRRRAVAEAGLYAVGIVLTFTLIGFALTFLVGAGGINRLATNSIVNAAIALVFILFALSLFGVLELQLPSSWLNAVNRRSSSTSGILGILLMAVTFSLTSFTCTVPFVGTVMVAALQGELLWSLLGVTAFATVFATPFFFLALFPSWLEALPKSGNWMNSVKITMGFLELAAALKFVSNIDLVHQWELLTRPVFITLWLAIALVTALYLLGFFRFPHENEGAPVGAPRVLFAIFFLAVSIYLLRGLFGLPLGELDAFLPPRDYGQPASLTQLSGTGKEEKEIWLSDYQAALDQARRESRPVFIDFTGYTCTNCRWMESNIFSRSEVRSRMQRLVLVRLYTDGAGPESEENLRFEQERFGTIALPLYAIMSPADEIIATFPGLTRDPQEFIHFLEKGLGTAPSD